MALDRQFEARGGAVADIGRGNDGITGRSEGNRSAKRRRDHIIGALRE